MYKNIKTERLFIRPISIQDADFMLELVNSKGWLKFIGDRKVSNRKDAENYVQNILDKEHSFYNVFELKGTRKPIGIVTFLKREDEKYPDFGFALLPEYKKKGYALEASTAYLKRIRNTNSFDNIIAITMPDNSKSIGLLLKLGFQHTGDHKKNGALLSYYTFVNEKP